MPSTISCGAVALRTAAAAALQLAGIALFSFAFFPVKPGLPGLSGLESYTDPTQNDTVDKQHLDLPRQQLRLLYEELSELPPKYDRLIIMVIDGLPAEFVLGRGDMRPTKEMMDAMPYTQNLVSNNNAIGYHAKAAPPTVTMPRLKAIVSGAIGGFLDVAFNFNTQAFLDDNLLEQLHHIGWKMVVYGDETWIKLFPKFFSRQDGVTSFYVKDTVEVDYNVSRHLDAELAAHDWNLMILHYLGLDHVGHTGGRESLLMIPKLNEMDKVIEKICTSIPLNGEHSSERTLLLVTSDHGMTDGGNHGGSSFEETDSLALFIDLGKQMLHPTMVKDRRVSQVDIAPTLALLLGVPIPKNNIGVLLLEVFEFLTDGQMLRALELNSWELLRLLKSQMPGLLCGDDFFESLDHKFLLGKYNRDIVKKLCLSYARAIHCHTAWKNSTSFDAISLNNTRTFTEAVEAYYDFLSSASKWLSTRATDKPSIMLLTGVLLIVSSSVAMLKLLISLIKDVKLIQMQSLAQKRRCLSLDLDEACIIVCILLHLVSLGSSSLVEEEQYTWHFLTSTLYLIFLLMKIQKFLSSEPLKQVCTAKGEKEREKLRHSFCTFILSDRYSHVDISFILIVLISGRILRSWHQGGVNWLHLADISKWLESSGSSITTLQLVSIFLVTFFGLFVTYYQNSVKTSASVIFMCHILLGSLILLNAVNPLVFLGVSLGGSLIPQIFYIVLLFGTVSTLASPWFARIHFVEGCLSDESVLQCTFPGCLRECLQLIGGSFVAMWCLLQLLLQHPVDSMPILLLLIQILACTIYFTADNRLLCMQWVKVSALYFLGMAGHFGLGNSNSIATINVAGAYTGLSGHSTTIAGFLMFVITYASPLLFQISGIMCLPTDVQKSSSIPNKSEFSHGLLRTIALPCLVPLVLNSCSLAVFTVVLLLMRNHLFVWSVFSPKYLYVCAATASIYIGVLIIAVSVAYVFAVLFCRIHWMSSHRSF